MSTEKYDVAIIGAGISGLVCGCYLAKAGVKTVLIEKNVRAGGYCTSFVHRKYHFEACAHGLGSLRVGGRLDMLFKDLNLYKDITIERKDPSDIIFTPFHRISIFNCLDRTILEFQKNFPKEKESIKKFIEYMAHGTLNEFFKHRGKTLQNLLDAYFKDEALKTILSVFILGFVGCAPHRISCVAASLVFREFVFDGGYLPVNGIQDFPNALLKRFVEYGGTIRLNSMAKKILFKGDKIDGVLLKDQQMIYAKKIVAACDMRQTFFKFVGEDKISKSMTEKIRKAEPSMSSFLVYLGLKDSYKIPQDKKANLWIINNLNSRSVYHNMMECSSDCLLITTGEHLSGRNKNISVRLETSIACRDRSFWTKEQTDKIAEGFIALSEKVLPDISKHILFKFSASPRTLNRWTKNYLGASFGWASLPHQFGEPDFSQKTEIENLYITGHWSNQSSGIAVVVNCGFDTAKLILKRGV